MGNKKERMYIISNIHPSRHNFINSVCSFLEKDLKLFKPHVDNEYNLDNAKIGFPAFYKDRVELDKADISLVLMPLFGRDCAAEIGYSQGIGNCVIAYAEKMEAIKERSWLDDWMVKGFIDYILTPDIKTYNLLSKNPLIKEKEIFEKKLGKNKLVHFIKNKKDLPNVIKELLKEKRKLN